MVTDNVPGPARVVLMKNSDWIPGMKKEEVSVTLMVYMDEEVWFGALFLGHRSSGGGLHGFPHRRVPFKA